MNILCGDGSTWITYSYILTRKLTCFTADDENNFRNVVLKFIKTMENTENNNCVMNNCFNVYESFQLFPKILDSKNITVVP
jgi:hypothetical protein